MIISRTPLRLSFVGGGTDLPGFYRIPGRYGAVVSTSINRYIYITANRKWDDLIRLSYSKTEIVDSVDKIEHNIIREALRIVGIERGIEIVYMADLPLTGGGSGLGSSSALAVGVLNALYAFKGQHVSAERLAQDACRIEIDILKNPIGKQDQYVAAYGGLNYIRFNGDEGVWLAPIICQPKTKQYLSDGMMLFFTGIERFSSDILQQQSAIIADRLPYHDRLVDLAEEMRTALCNNDLSSFGRILHEGWECKRRLADAISNSDIDNWYEAGRRAGAFGGKIAGAGGGGFLMLFADRDDQEHVKRALSNLRSDTVEIESQGSKIIYVSD